MGGEYIYETMEYEDWFATMREYAVCPMYILYSRRAINLNFKLIKMKKFLVLSAIVLGLSALNVAIAKVTEHEATNCKHTGNSSDYCNASSGTQNVRVLECKPGATDCNYMLP